MTRNDSALAALFKLSNLMVGVNTYTLVGNYMVHREVGRINLMVKHPDGYVQVVAAWLPDGRPMHGHYFNNARIKIALYDLRRLLILEELADI